MGRLLLAHLLVGRPILVRGAVLPPSFDHRRQPHFCWVNKDGLPFTIRQWQGEFSRRTLAAFGVLMSPMAAGHLTVGVVCDGYPGAPTRQQAADVMGHSLDQQQKSYWLGRQRSPMRWGCLPQLRHCTELPGMHECTGERCAQLDGDLAAQGCVHCCKQGRLAWRASEAKCWGRVHRVLQQRSPRPNGRRQKSCGCPQIRMMSSECDVLPAA